MISQHIIDENAIINFWGKYRFLSNFYEAPIRYKGIVYPTVEHAYQTFKLKNERDRNIIRAALTPTEAKKLGQRFQLRDNFEQVKMSIMYTFVFEKFKSHPRLHLKLIETEDRYLLEGNTWHDNTWGHCFCHRCVGKEYENKLGIVLMKVRENLR